LTATSSVSESEGSETGNNSEECTNEGSGGIGTSADVEANFEIRVFSSGVVGSVLEGLELSGSLSKSGVGRAVLEASDGDPQVSLRTIALIEHIITNSSNVLSWDLSNTNASVVISFGGALAGLPV